MTNKDTFKEKPRGNIYMEMDANREIFWGAPMNPNVKQEMIEGLRHYRVKCSSKGCGQYFNPNDREAREFHTTHADIAYMRLNAGILLFDVKLERKKKQRGGEMVEFKEGKLGEPRNMKASIVSYNIEPSTLGIQQGKPSNQLHLVLNPKDQPWKDQHEWYGLSDKTYSAFKMLVDKCIELGLITTASVSKAASLEALAEIIGKRLKAEGIRKWAETKMGDKALKPKWCPQ